MLFGIILIVVMGVLSVLTTILWFRDKTHEFKFTDIYDRLKEICNTIRIYSATARQVVENDAKINVIVDMLIRNAKTEAVIKGLATINSPLMVSDDARLAFSGITGDLKSYYKETGRFLTENDLFLDVQKRFGDIIFNDICISLRIMNNACILIAIEIAKEQG